jgi:nucleotide-binding universal stress UspA family protein
LTVTTSVVEADPKRELVALADSWKADTLFIGATSLSRLDQFLSRSVAAFVLKHAHCAVEIVRRASSGGWEKDTPSRL